MSTLQTLSYKNSKQAYSADLFTSFYNSLHISAIHINIFEISSFQKKKKMFEIFAQFQPAPGVFCISPGPSRSPGSISILHSVQIPLHAHPPYKHGNAQMTLESDHTVY